MDKVFKCLGSSSHALEARANHDYYATAPSAVEDLLQVEKFGKTILEPCCGEGHISKVLLNHGYEVINYDLIDRGYYHNFTQVNFLSEDVSTDEQDVDIITNPPYTGNLHFIKKCIEIVPKGRKVAMLLRIQFLESQARKVFFEEFPPKTVYVFSKRTTCAPNGDFDHTNAAVCFCWFVWEKGFKGDPVIKWI